MELQRDYLNLKPTTQAKLCCIPAKTFSIKDTLNTRDLIRIRPDRKILRTGHKQHKDYAIFHNMKDDILGKKLNKSP